MKVLGLDTSTALLSAAVLDDGRLVAECARESAPASGRRPGRSNHAEGVLPVIEEVLERAGTDFPSLGLVGVAVGPGTFTGLRIGISTVKGLVYGSGTPVVGVRTLEAAAYRVPVGEDGATCVCPMLDARKGQVYGALYRRTAQAFECLLEDALSAPEALARQADALASGSCVFVGAGAEAYAEVIAGSTDGRARVAAGAGFPSTASAVARLALEKFRTGPEAAAGALAPLYLRAPDAAVGAGRAAPGAGGG